MFKKGDTFDPSKDIPSLEGKSVVITGGTSGLGRQSAFDLARHGPSAIWITGRDTERGAEVVQTLKEIAPSVQAHFLSMDLASFKSVQEASQSLLSSVSRIDILLLNAGVLNMPPGHTQEGYEVHFGINHMGHALFLKLLLPLLLKSSELGRVGTPSTTVRIVCLSSDGHNFCPKGGINFQSLTGDGLGINVFYLYGQSKLANILYARQLAKRFPQFITVSVHPGAVKTDLLKPGVGSMVGRVFQKIVLPFIGVGVEEGVKNQLWAATASELQTGEFYYPVGIRGKASKLAQDESLGNKLWKWTETELETNGYR